MNSNSMQEVGSEAERGSFKFSFQTLSNWKATQPCRKRSLSNRNITSFPAFRSCPFISPQSHQPTQGSSYHNECFSQAEAVVKETASCFAPIYWFLDPKRRKSRLVRTSRAKGKYRNGMRVRIAVPKKQELPSLSSISTVHDTKPMLLCGTSPGNHALQDQSQTLSALYVPSSP